MRLVTDIINQYFQRIHEILKIDKIEYSKKHDKKKLAEKTETPEEESTENDQPMKTEP